jgi:WD40 repeat protein
VATGRETAVLRGHEHWVMSAAFSPDGRRVVTTSLDKTARLWDVANKAELAVLRRQEADWAAFSHDSTRLVTTSEDATAHL